jgi:phosphate transport system substrate-binding protein
MYLIKKPKTLKHKLHAVSPVVATLVLIVVAIVGAIAVGLIMSRVASDTSNQANVGNVANNAQETLTIGGSTTIYPVTQAAIANFEAAYPGVSVQDAQGGSGAGMEGVTIGALNIGAASSLSAVTTAQTSDSSLNPPVNLVATQIGGSGIVVITNGLGAGKFLTDGANVCNGIDQAALAKIFNAALVGNTGFFTIGVGACAAGAPDFGILDAANVAYAASGAAGAIQAVSRSDLPSGTEDTFSSYIGTGSSAPAAGFAGLQVSGNPGVLTQVQKAPGAANPGGSIAFVDLGFAEGAASGITCATTSGFACGVAIPQVFTNLPAAAVAFTLNAASGASTATIHAAVLAGLVNAQKSVDSFPDATGTLVRTFYYVTNGNPTPTEQDFINFMTSPNAEAYFTAQGYYPIYSYA